MDFQFLKFEKIDEVGILTIDRAQALNALNQDLLNELSQFFKEPPRGIKALILTGSGKAFVAGADIKAFKDMTSDEARMLSTTGQNLFRLIEDSSLPVLAAVNGFALGGGLELALACDFIISSSQAKLGLPEVSLGLIPGYGGTQRLSRQVGPSIAKALTLSGEIFTSEQFMKWGLVVEVTLPEQLMERSLWWATKISEKSSHAVNLAKKAIMNGFDKNLSEGLELESHLFANCFQHVDQKEGVSAFLEKRKPKFL